jgi:4-hydroxy-tetrahydrodipicolinate reductase
MGRLVGELAPAYGHEIAGIVDPVSHPGNVDDERWRSADVAVDFSLPDAVPVNLPKLAGLGLNVVVGTTGWSRHEAELRRIATDHGIGVVAAPNFSAGVVMFEAIVARAAALAAQTGFEAWLHEAHHAQKKDAPSGTALLLKTAMEKAGFARPIDVSATRAGHIPGTHTVGFDGPAESITLAHSARDRSAFARGALQAAGWIKGRRGWFTMKDVMGIDA